MKNKQKKIPKTFKWNIYILNYNILNVSIMT